MKRFHPLLLVIVVLLTAAVPAATVSAGTPDRETPNGLRLIRSDAQGIELLLEGSHYSLQSTVTLDGVACQRIEIPGGAQAGQAGAPQLPVLVALFGVPSHAALSITTTPLERVELVSNFNPCPAPQAVAEEDADGTLRYVEQDVVPNADIYGLDALYPIQPARIQDLGFMRSQRLARVELSPFQVNPATGTLLFHRRLQVSISFGDQVAIQASSSIVEPPVYEQTLQGMLLNYAEARTWRTPATVDAAANRGWMPPQPSYRIAVQEEGIYALGRSDLQQAGLPVDTLDPNKLQIFYEGQEISILVTGAGDGKFDEGDQILFYGQSIDARYTDTNVYWLTYGGTYGMRMVEKSGTAGRQAQEATVHQVTAWSEQNINYVSTLPLDGNHDHWYGTRLLAQRNQPGGYDAPLTLPHAVSENFTATLEVGLVGVVTGEHHLKLRVNGSEVYAGSWHGRTYHIASAVFSQTALVDGPNTIRVELSVDDSGQALDLAYLDFISLRYWRNLVAEEDQIFFSSNAPDAWNYTLSGFSRDDVRVYDVTNPHRVSTVRTSTSAGQVRFGDNQTTQHRYLALTPSRYRSPISITRAEETTLLAPLNGADYLIIAHGDFTGAIQPLASYRRQQGYRVQVIDVQTIYDQFNYGRASAEAIRDFLAHAYRNWLPPAPSYVLLVGDGTYDPRRYLSDSVPTYIPPYLATVDPHLGETAADNRYVTLSDNDQFPAMMLGRFPAQTVADVEAMVQKTLQYEQTGIDDNWNENVLFIADNLLGGGGSFYEFSDAIADGFVNLGKAQTQLLPERFRKSKLYLDRTCSTQLGDNSCQQQIIDSINQGALLVSYIGHAGKQFWAEEKLLSLSMLSQLNNEARLPIMLPMTCLEGFFHEPKPGAEALGEAIVRMPNRGAVASWSPTGLGLATGHDYLETGFFLALFHEDNVGTLGAAATYGKLYLLSHAPIDKYDDLLDTYTLFGDPALHVRLPGTGPLSQHQLFLPNLTRS